MPPSLPRVGVVTYLCVLQLSERGPVEVLLEVDNTIELQTNPVACNALGGDCGQTQPDDESVASSRADSATMRAEKDAAQESISVTSVESSDVVWFNGHQPTEKHKESACQEPVIIHV